jgi:hypothetical protein
MLPFFRTPMQGDGMRVEPDQTVFVVTALSAIITTLFFGALPAWRAARGNPAGVMKSRSAVQRPTSSRGFVAVQVALSVVLVVVAALLSQSLLRLQNEHTGFALDRVTMRSPHRHHRSRSGRRHPFADGINAGKSCGAMSARSRNRKGRPNPRYSLRRTESGSELIALRAGR